MKNTVTYFLFLSLLFIVCSSRQNFRLLKVSRCNKEKNHTIYLLSKRKMIADVNYYDMIFTLKEPFDNNNRGHLELYKIGSKDQERRLITLKVKGWCNFVIENGGELYMEVAKKLKLPHPKTCPLDKGVFHLNWTELNFDKIKLVNLVPRGKFELKWIYFSLKDQSELACQEVVVQKF